MAPPPSPYWVEPRSHKADARQSWAIFVVARLDSSPIGLHYPVAAIDCRTYGWECNFDIQGGREPRNVFAAILGAVAVFSDESNHTAIQSELALATGFYQNARTVPRHCKMEAPGWAFWVDHRADARKEGSGEREASTGEFPFIFTCLQLGVALREASLGERLPAVAPALVDPEPDDSADRRCRYGMVVLDITDLNAVRYGIVGLWVDKLIPPPSPPASPVAENQPTPLGIRPPVAEELPPWTPSSAAGYISKFGYGRHYDSAGPELAELEKLPLIEPSAADVIWPTVIRPPVTCCVLPSPLSPCGPESLSDQAVAVLIRSVAETGSFDRDVLDSASCLPEFNDVLWRNLLRLSESVGHSRGAGQLISFLFTAQKHLDLGPFRGLSAEAIAGALATSSPSPKSISICVDTVTCHAAQILHVLAQFNNVLDWYFVADPGSARHVRGNQMASMLSARPDVIRGKIVISKGFSRLNFDHPWLPAAKPSMPFSIFPVYHMFVCQHTGYWEAAWANDYHFGGAMIRAERFAHGFLSYLVGLLERGSLRDSETELYKFSTAPSSLAETSRVEVSPIPGDGIMRPRYPIEKVNGCPQPKLLWTPLPHDLPRGCWVVLVSRFLHRVQAGLGHYLETEYCRYAFLRARVRIEVNPPPETLSPEEIDVVGLEEFLQETAPEVSQALVRRRLGGFFLAADAVPNQAPLPSGVERLVVMQHKEAAWTLLDCLAGPGLVKDELYAAKWEGEEHPLWHVERPASFTYPWGNLRW